MFLSWSPPLQHLRPQWHAMACSLLNLSLVWEVLPYQKNMCSPISDSYLKFTNSLQFPGSFLATILLSSSKQNLRVPQIHVSWALSPQQCFLPWLPNLTLIPSLQHLTLTTNSWTVSPLWPSGQHPPMILLSCPLLVFQIPFSLSLNVNIPWGSALVLIFPHSVNFPRWDSPCPQPVLPSLY